MRYRITNIPILMIRSQGNLIPKVSINVGSSRKDDDQAFASPAIMPDAQKILEMDLALSFGVEGDEFSEPQRISEEDLKEIRIVDVEVRELNVIIKREYRKSIICWMFMEIVQDFSPVHSHTNKCCGAHFIHEIEIPRFLALKLHTNSRRSGRLKAREIPHKLNMPFNRSKEDMNRAVKSA